MSDQYGPPLVEAAGRRSWSISLKVGTAVAAVGALVTLAGPAKAVPSFARQTGLACEACHTIFPQLTPFGRRFKLNGYTLTTEHGVSDVDSKGNSVLSLAKFPPISAMIQVTDTWWQNTDKNGGQGGQGSVLFPRQFSLFYAGRITNHIGAYSQLTYEGNADHLGIDNTDIRYSNHTAHDTWVWGVSLNNNPGVQDLWENNAGGWAFPFIKPGSKGGKYWNANQQPLIMSLGQTTAGLTAYGFYDNSLYFEAGVYRSAVPGHMTYTGTNANTNSGTISGYAPYWRLAYEKDWSHNSLEAGTTGMYTQESSTANGNNPAANGYAYTLNGNPISTYTDLGFDAQYEHIKNDNTFELTGNYWHEWQHNRSDGQGAYWSVENGANASNANDSVDFFEGAGTYYWQRKIGGSLGYVYQTGSKDAGLYGNNNSPTTDFETLEVDYLPWLNTKFSVQYNIYNEVNGVSSHASDYNSLMLGMWTAF